MNTNQALVRYHDSLARAGNGPRRSAVSQRNGAAAVEFALICPFVMLLALACTDFGRISHHYEIVANAARCGAERGAAQQYTDYTRADWETNLEEAVLEELDNLPNFDPSELTFSLSTTTDVDGVARIAVEVEYPFRTAVSWPGLPSETQLRKRFEFRQFR
jgi:Flp pilus assembly protein TadG